MCGFVGFIDNSVTHFDYEKIISKCGQDISFRGPDESKNYIDFPNKIFLSFQRLSFRDLSTNGSQPMLSYNNRYLVLFNGEVYNFQFLLSELDIFSDEIKSDTRLLTEYISQYGIYNLLDKLDGMFAITVIDLQKKKVFFISDQFCQKPLYFSIQNNILFFSSDIRTINNHQNFKTIISKKSLSIFLKKNFIPSPLSIYENVNKLEAGTLIEINYKNNLTIDKVIKYKKSFDNNLEVSKFNIETLDQKLNQSVLEHLDSDVEIGSFLSSGIDSSLITAIASKHNKKIKSFSLGFVQDQFDESKDASDIADFLKIKNHRIEFNENKLEQLLFTVSDIYSEPFSDSSQVPYIALCQKTSSYVKGVLSGDGGDELFGGYIRHQLSDTLFSQRNNFIFKLFFLLINNKLSSKILNLFGVIYPLEKLNRLDKALKSQNIVDFYDNLTSHHEFTNLVKNFKENIYLDEFIKEDLNSSKNIMIFDQNFYLPNDLMVKSDRASMYYGLEVRSPLLSKQIYDYSNSLSKVELLTKKNIQKYCLKSVIEKYLPKNFISKRKKGFVAPIDYWMKNNLKNLLSHYLSDKMLSHDLFESKLIKQNLNDFKSGKNNHYALWDIFIFQLWFHRYHSL